MAFVSFPDSGPFISYLKSGIPEQGAGNETSMAYCSTVCFVPNIIFLHFVPCSGIILKQGAQCRKIILGTRQLYRTIYIYSHACTSN